MTNNEKENRIQSILPETSIHDLLAELLPEMGYSDVKITHERGNRPENGKDVIASLYDDIEDRKDWTAFVVKKGNISGTSTSIREVQDQVNDCFQYEYKSVIDKLRIRVSKVKVVCNGNISGGAEDKIHQNNNFEKANIVFWDKAKLVRFIDRYYPSYWIEGSKVYKDYIDRFHDNINRDSRLKAIGTSDDKIQKIIKCVVSPRISERIELEDGVMSNKSREISYLTTQSGVLVVTGNAGTGKSTLLKTISKFVIEQNSLRNNTEFYPILIDAVDIKLASNSLPKAVNRYFRQDWTKSLKLKIEDLLINSNFILFIDAIDEIADVVERESVVNEIARFSEEHPKVRIVCTSRPVSIFSESDSTSIFRHFRLKNLNVRQVQEFIDNYFSENQIKSQRLRKSLQDSGILEKLPRTPLSLALITILYDDSEIEIPATITDLYAHFTDVLLEKNLVKKTIDIIEFSIKHRIICLLAYRLHSLKTDRIPQSEFEMIIDEYNNERKRDVDAKRIVQLLTRKSGILFKSKSGNISFKHLSFQEYFTAFEFFNYRKSEELFLVDNFNDEWWQNVSIFYGGMNKDAPEFLNRIASLSLSEDIRRNMMHVAGMGKLLQAVYNTPAENKIKGLASSLDNVEAVITRMDNAIETLSNKSIAHLSRFALNQVIYFYFSANHNSVTLRDTIESSYANLSSELHRETDELEILKLERKIFGLVVASVDFDRSNIELLADFTDQRKSSDNLLTAASYSFFKYEFDSLSKPVRRSDKMKKLSKRMTKSIKNLRLTDDLTKSIKTLSNQDNFFQEE